MDYKASAPTSHMVNDNLLCFTWVRTLMLIPGVKVSMFSPKSHAIRRLVIYLAFNTFVLQLART